jgi:hypothetical protein
MPARCTARVVPLGPPPFDGDICCDCRNLPIIKTANHHRFPYQIHRQHDCVRAYIRLSVSGPIHSIGYRCFLFEYVMFLVGNDILLFGNNMFLFENDVRPPQQHKYKIKNPQYYPVIPSTIEAGI